VVRRDETSRSGWKFWLDSVACDEAEVDEVKPLDEWGHEFGYEHLVGRLLKRMGIMGDGTGWCRTGSVQNRLYNCFTDILS
jgi:hypothetical protein